MTSIADEAATASAPAAETTVRCGCGVEHHVALQIDDTILERAVRRVLQAEIDLATRKAYSFRHPDLVGLTAQEREEC